MESSAWCWAWPSWRKASSRGTSLPFDLEVIGFSEEEGVRFAKPFLGSLALVGELDAATLARTDAQRPHRRRRDPQLRPRPRRTARRRRSIDSAFAYLEFHIEQGPVLESEGLALGVVDAIAGQTRMQFTFTGHANHAGTTPMGPLRHDALAAAAEWIVEVERYASAIPGLVATVGRVEVPSAAANVIPGACIATLDVRHAQDSVRNAAVQHYFDYAKRAGAARGVAVADTTSLDQPAVPMDPVLTSLLTDAATRTTGHPDPRHHQRRRPRCHDRRPPLARRHALPALARRPQSPSRRGGRSRGRRSRTRRRGGVPAHLAR